MPESALTAPKEKKLTGRQWFESGRAAGVIYFPRYGPLLNQGCLEIYISYLNIPPKTNY